jgi:hypothetical protein
LFLLPFLGAANAAGIGIGIGTGTGTTVILLLIAAVDCKGRRSRSERCATRFMMDGWVGGWVDGDWSMEDGGWIVQNKSINYMIIISIATRNEVFFS